MATPGALEEARKEDGDDEDGGDILISAAHIPIMRIRWTEGV